MQKWFLTWRPEAWLWSIRSGLWHSNLSIWINWSILQKDLFLGACPYTHYEGEVVSRHKVTNMQLGSNSSLHFYSQRDCLKCVTHAWDVSQLVLWESPLCAPGNSTSGPALCKASGILLSLSIDLCNGPTCRELSTGSWPIHTHSCGIMMKCTYSPSCPKLCRFIFTDAFLTLYLRQNDVQALFSSQLICVFSYLLTKDSSPEIFASAKRYWHSKIPSFFFFFSDSLFFFFFWLCAYNRLYLLLLWICLCRKDVSVHCSQAQLPKLFSGASEWVITAAKEVLFVLVRSVCFLIYFMWFQVNLRHINFCFYSLFHLEHSHY